MSTLQPSYYFDSDEAVVATALNILEQRLGYPGQACTSPEDVKRFVTLEVSELPHEVFGCLYLDNRNCLIGSEHLFRGTIDGASVYPREVVKAAMVHNAAALIFYHNHPSGHAEPSAADRNLTRRLIDALALIDVRVLDHIVVGHRETVSFAERGLL